MDIIIATYGSVLFGFGYHRWLIATKTETILLAGVGAYDGPQNLMTSYRSELGGITAGLGVLGTIVRSGRISIRNVEFICDNSAAILASSRGVTTSVFHHTESYYDLIATIKYL